MDAGKPRSPERPASYSMAAMELTRGHGVTRKMTRKMTPSTESLSLIITVGMKQASTTKQPILR